MFELTSIKKRVPASHFCLCLSDSYLHYMLFLKVTIGNVILTKSNMYFYCKMELCMAKVDCKLLKPCSWPAGVGSALLVSLN